MANLTLIEAMTKTADLVYKKVKALLDNKVDKIDGKGLSTNDYTAAEKQKLSNIAPGAQVNQNAFSQVKVGETTISADTITDLLTLEAGDNVQIIGDVNKDSVTISANAHVGLMPYGTTSGTSTAYSLEVDGESYKQKMAVLANFHVANGNSPTLAVTFMNGLSGSGGTAIPIWYKGAPLTANMIPAKATVLLVLAQITGNTPHWDLIYSVDTNTTYHNATQAGSGLMSEVDKRKLDAFRNATDYALKTDMANVYRYKGSVETYNDLPSVSNALGDVWDVKSDGKNYAWKGEAWDDLGGVLKIDETALTSAINKILT